MMSFWFFVPKSGVAFIFISVALILIWNAYREVLEHPYFVIIFAEVLLFLICLYIANKESNEKQKG